MKEFDTAPKYPNARTWRRLLSVLVLILYLVSCFAPVIQTKAVPHDGRRGEWGGGQPSGSLPGWLALLLGWAVDVPGQPPGVAWSANLFLFVGLALLLRGYPWIAVGLGGIGSLAGLSVFWLANNPASSIQSLHWGFYIWLASLFSLALGSLSICMAATPAGKSWAEKPGIEGTTLAE